MKSNLKNWKKKKAAKIGAGIAGILVLVLVGGLLIHGKNAKGKEAETSVQSATAEKGTISTTIVGTGTIDSADTTTISIPAGLKIKKVLVETGDEVKKGQKLATVTEASVAKLLLEVKDTIEEKEDELDDLSDDVNDSSTTEYLEAKVLKGELSELYDLKEELTDLMKTKTIKATCNGVIENISVAADTEAGTAEDTSSTTNAANQSQNSGNGTIGVSVKTSGNSNNTKSSNNTYTSNNEKNDLIYLSTAGVKENAKSSTEASIKECTIDITAPVAGAKPQTKRESSDYFTGTISWNCSTETFQPETVYTATIKLTAKDGYVFSQNIIPEVPGADVTYEVLKSDALESILKIKAKFAKTAKISSTGTNEETQENSSTGNSLNGNSKNNNAASTGSTVSGTSSGQGVSGRSSKEISSVSGGTVSGVSASGSSSSTSSGSSSQTGISEESSIYYTEAFSVSSQEKVAVSINVDEMDINSVQVGQSAVVTLDALEGQEFEGEITKISATASSSGNSVKYPVEIELEKADGMLRGMSASATINVDEVKDAVLIPVNALQEKGNQTFVYTEADADGNLSGEVQVETGLSNGSQVQITSGLNEGDTVYYVKVGSDKSENGMQQMGGRQGMFQSGEKPSDGEMPSGGDMPSGGGKPSGGEMPSGGGPSGNPGSNNEN